LHLVFIAFNLLRKCFDLIIRLFKRSFFLCEPTLLPVELELDSVLLFLCLCCLFLEKFNRFFEILHSLSLYVASGQLVLQLLDLFGQIAILGLKLLQDLCSVFQKLHFRLRLLCNVQPFFVLN
jgi:hypothetical protein